MAVAARKRKISALGWRHELLGLLFTSPWSVGFLLFTHPLVSSLYSLTL